MFEKIWGQNRAKTILSGMIHNQKISHAYLFTGPPGCSQKTTALEFAQALNCQKVDTLEIEPDGANLKIDQIRELKTLTQYGPALSQYQIIIINEADTLTIEAANSFLKLLEEPPPNVCFILITCREHALPATIKSRCQKIFFGPLSDQIKKSDEEIVWLYQDLKSLPNLNTVDLFHLAQKISEGKEAKDVEDILSILLDWYRSNSRSAAPLRIILEAIKQLKKRANLKLTLEIMLLKLKELTNA